MTVDSLLCDEHTTVTQVRLLVSSPSLLVVNSTIVHFSLVLIDSQLIKYVSCWLDPPIENPAEYGLLFVPLGFRTFSHGWLMDGAL